MRSMTLREIASLLNYQQPLCDYSIQGFSSDTRLLKPGEVYVALAGERVDGHAYLNEANKKGAKAAIVAASYQGPDYGLHLFCVEDPLKALQELASRVLARQSCRLVAVTGSIGKTTTKEFIKTILSRRYLVAASPGNNNSQVGLPLAILNHTTGKEDILVLEMGMTAPGHLARLVRLFPPEVAVITSVALVHACNFNSLEDIALAKAELLSHPSTKLGLLHYDMPSFEAIKKIGACHKRSFSRTSSQADYYLNGQADNTIEDAVEKQRVCVGNLAVPGRHNAHNFLAASAVARYFGLEWEEIKQAASDLQLPEKRLQFVKQGGMIFLNDSYNASEMSVKAALETLPEASPGGGKVAVLGSMMELGKFSDECHQRVGEFALDYVEKVYCLGEECRPIYEVWKKAGRPVDLFTDRAALVDCLRRILKPSDVVLLKGSRSKELWKVLEEL